MMFHEIGPAALHIDYKNLQPEDGDIFLCYEGARELLACEKDGFRLPTVAEARAGLGLSEDAEFTYLFSVDETRYFMCRTAVPAAFGDFSMLPTRVLRTVKPLELAYPAALGMQLSLWYGRNRFCGRCGGKTVHAEKERMLRCPSCGNMIYPQICPSVIVGVLDPKNERMLVTCYNPAHLMVNAGTASRASTGYALVAGYVESGETPEETVIREVREEVGLKVKNIRYYKSQPWPFSSTLLLGYVCDVDGATEITLEEDELSSAVWLRREEMPDRSDQISLTSEIMELFRLGKV